MATGGEILVESFKLAGVHHVFGLPGTQTLAVWDALLAQDHVASVFLRNEQNMSTAAKGYAQAGGGVSACVTVPGPGATNMITGVQDAFTDSAPMLLVTTDIPREHLGKGAVHECDLAALFKPAVKAQEIVETHDELAGAVFRAIVTSTSGRPGPVQVLVSGQLLRAASDVHLPTQKEWERVRSELAPRRAWTEEELDAVAAVLSAAQHPVIYAGGGAAAAGADKAIMDVATRLGAPVVTSLAARGIIPEDHPLAVGVPFFPGVAGLLEQADAALVVGTRFSEFSTASWSFPLPENTVRIDIDEEALHLNYPASHPIRGDAREVLESLSGRLRSGRAAWGDRVADVKAAQQTVTMDTLRGEVKPGGRVHPMAGLRAVREVIAPDAVVTMDGSATEMWLMDPSFPMHGARGFLCSEVFQGLGAALPIAIGAKVAQPERQVVCVTGDGGLMYTVGEFAALTSQNIGVKIVVFDDGGWYNSIRQFQDAFFEGRYIGTFLGNPDFRQLAESFGIPCEIAGSADQVEPGMRAVLDAPGPAMLVIEIDREPIAPRFKVRITERRKTL